MALSTRTGDSGRAFHWGVVNRKYVQPGEGYLNRHTGTLYYYPLLGEEPNESMFIAPVLKSEFLSAAVVARGLRSAARQQLDNGPRHCQTWANGRHAVPVPIRIADDHSHRRRPTQTCPPNRKEGEP